MARRIRRTNRKNSKRLNSRHRSKVRNHRNTMNRRNTRRMGGAEETWDLPEDPWDLPEDQQIDLVTSEWTKAKKAQAAAHAKYAKNSAADLKAARLAHRASRKQAFTNAAPSPENQLIDLVRGNQPVIKYLLSVIDGRTAPIDLQEKLILLSNQSYTF